jgi:hypothetical protein
MDRQAHYSLHLMAAPAVREVQEGVVAVPAVRVAEEMADHYHLTRTERAGAVAVVEPAELIPLGARTAIREQFLSY